MHFFHKGDSSSPSDNQPKDKYHKKAALGANIDLECSLTREDIDLYWRKSSGVNKSETHLPLIIKLKFGFKSISPYQRSHKGKLIIYYLKQEDSGEYICTSPDGQSASAKLTVYDPNTSQAEEEHSTDESKIF